MIRELNKGHTHKPVEMKTTSVNPGTMSERRDNLSNADTVKANGRRRCCGHISIIDLGQPVLQGYKQQVQGSNGWNPAQLCCPWGSTQTFPSMHNRVKHPCRDGHAVIQAWGIAHIPRVDPREGRIRLPREKDLNQQAATIQQRTINERDNNHTTTKVKGKPKAEVKTLEGKHGTVSSGILEQHDNGIQGRSALSRGKLKRP